MVALFRSDETIHRIGGPAARVGRGLDGPDLLHGPRFTCCRFLGPRTADSESDKQHPKARVFHG